VGLSGQPVEVDHNTRGKWVRKAREIQDLQGLEARNSKFKGLAEVLDSEGTKRMRRGLGLSVDRLAALTGAQCGDVVVNAQARYWNGGNAECPCVEAVETRQHLFWECPRWENTRRQIRGNHGNPQVNTMAALTAEFGLCTWLPEVRAWWRTLVVTRPDSQRVHGAVSTDGSALFPKDPQIRVASWSVVWRTRDGVWHEASGTCTPPHSAARGEVEALLHVCLWAVGECRVMVDCESVVYGFQALRRGGPCYQKLLRGPCGDLWKRFPVSQHNIQVKWIPKGWIVD
jgi:hypothetical protein